MFMCYTLASQSLTNQAEDREVITLITRDVDPFGTPWWNLNRARTRRVGKSRFCPTASSPLARLPREEVLRPQT